MTVYVLRDGKLVEKASIAVADRRSIFPTPMISRLEPYESPVTGEEITSWRQRDADMAAAGAYDPRDLSPDHVYARGREIQLKEAADGPERYPDIWTDPADKRRG
ncbi:hypothetical protein [Mesorhizobium sp.]|uniref:hypothetical protein n=1 Tax=Mesorhizobium sp. TaxID=1871066 RepID=UPI000FE4BC34|nr:hypothetical protein [Mesorhizobium sp.]RWP05094.1 MAG: hypothetical protein EOQ99_16625 [Mesorhizobium sp.]